MHDGCRCDRRIAFVCTFALEGLHGNSAERTFCHYSTSAPHKSALVNANLLRSWLPTSDISHLFMTKVAAKIGCSKNIIELRFAHAMCSGGGGCPMSNRRISHRRVTFSFAPIVLRSAIYSAHVCTTCASIAFRIYFFRQFPRPTNSSVITEFRIIIIIISLVQWLIASDRGAFVVLSFKLSASRRDRVIDRRMEVKIKSKYDHIVAEITISITVASGR